MTARHLEPGENDLELLGLGGAVGTVVCGLGWVASGLPMPRCAFHAVTGCPCPTCGATRCALALLHGRMGEAMGWNPLAFAGVAGMTVFSLYAAGVLTGWLPRVRVGLDGMEGRWLRVGFFVLVAANWGYLIHRGV